MDKQKNEKNEPLQSRHLIFNVLGIGLFLFCAAFSRPSEASEFYIENIHDYSCDTFGEQKDYEINIPAGTSDLMVQMSRSSLGATGDASLSLPDTLDDIYPTETMTRAPGIYEPMISIWHLVDQSIGSTTLRIDINNWQNHDSSVNLGVYAIDTSGSTLFATSSFDVSNYYPSMWPFSIYSEEQNLIFGMPQNTYHGDDSFTTTYTSDTINQQADGCYQNYYYTVNGLYTNGETLPSYSTFNVSRQSDTFGYYYQIQFTEGIPPEPPEVHPLSYYGIIITPDQNTCFGNQKIRIFQDNSAQFFIDNPSTNIYKSKLLVFATIASTSFCNASTTMTSGNFFDYYTPAGYIDLATTTTPVGKNEICIKYWQQGFLDDIYATTSIIVAPATSTACTTAQLPIKTSWCKFSDICDEWASSTNEFFYGIMCGTRLALCWAFAPTPSALDFISNDFYEMKKVVPFVYYYNLSDSILSGFSTSSFIGASSTIGLPMYNGTLYYIIPVLSSSSVSNLIGATNAQILYDTISYFIWASVAILIITILIFTIPLIL